jgi:PAS domain S-box-containing protein
VDTPLSVLLLEDNPDDAELLVYELRRAGYAPDWRRVESKAEFLDALAGEPEIILADYALPQFSALDALHMLHSGSHDIPAIVVSGAMSEEACVDALRHGAVDYLLKDRLTRLGAAVRHALAQQGLVIASREHEQRFRAAFDHAPIGMAVTTLDGLALEVNQAMRQMTGLEPGGSLVNVIADEDRSIVDTYLEQLLGGGAGLGFREVRLRDAAGHALWGQYSGSLIVNGGEGGHVVHQIADVTDRRRAEQALQRSVADLAQTNTELQELDRLKSDFIATVSHELRTPLTSIRGYTEILADDDGLTLPHRNMVSIIDRNGQRLMSLIEDLLTFSSIESGTLELDLGPVALRPIVEDACEAIRAAAEASDLLVVRDVPAGLPIVDGDQAQLKRVLVNLLSNAVKFGRPGGSVWVSAVIDQDEVVVSVRDNGVGIPGDEQAMLFTRFYRTTDAQKRAINGSGLGLAISKAIVEAHNGWILLESTVDEGTTVRFGLPSITV